MFRLYALWLYFAEKDWTGPAPPYGNRIKHRRDRTSGWIWSAGKFCKTIPACYWIITTRIPKAYKIGLVQMGKQCKHIHVLRFWPDRTGQNACWGITPKPPRSPPSVTATRPADAKKIFKRKAAELVIALQLPFSYIEFIAYSINAFYIVRQIRCNPDFLSQVAYMVVDCLPGIVGVVLMPYQIQ